MRFREIEREILRAARRTGTRPYLVGGAVRDALGGRTTNDLDLALPSGAETLARELSRRGLGTAFPLSPPESPVPVWRVARSGLTIDVARFENEGGIEEDLARRDFTVNAIAREIGRRNLIDPFGGVADVARRRVRALSGKNLVEDPLRVLRGYRIAATSGWRIEPRTRRLLAAAAPGLARVAAERIHDELARLLAAPATAALRWALRDGVLEGVLGLADGPALRRAITALPSPRRGQGASEVLAGRIAILFRAAGVGTGRASRALSAAKFSRAEIRDAGALLRSLDAVFSAEDPFRALFAHPGDRRALARIARAAARTDRERRRAQALATALRRSAPDAAPVDGHDLAAWLGIRPGPALGRALAEARFRWFAREWRSTEEIRRGLAGIAFD